MNTATSEPEKFRGVNNRLCPEQLEAGYLYDAQNVRLRTSDAVPRKGLVKPAWLNSTSALVSSKVSPVGAFYGLGVFKDPNGLEWIIQCSDGFVYRCRPHNERQSLAMPDGVRVLGPCVPVQAFNQVWLFRGRHLPPLVIADLDTGVEDIVPHWDSGVTYAADDNVAWGPWTTLCAPVDITGEVTGDLDTATVSHVAHGFSDGDNVKVTGASPSRFNGQFTITVVSADQFTYPIAAGVPGLATGTITAQRVALTSASGLVTVSCAQEHGYITGADITIRGCDQTEYNGRWNITVQDAYTFTFNFPGSATSPATGTIKMSNQAHYWKALRTTVADDPDTSASDWARAYDILPNADEALFLNNRLYVPTAYTPSDGAATYDSTSSYSKTDFIVATEIGDDRHFVFDNELRINQGSDDEIVTLAKYNQDTLLVFKERSWGMLTGLADWQNLALDMRFDGYGACARAVCVAGKNVYFAARRRGLVSVTQNELGKVNSVDIPFSDDIQGYVNRIHWGYAEQQRLAYWDDKLYWAVALDETTVDGAEQARGGEWEAISNGLENPYPGLYRLQLTEGQRYRLTLAETNRCTTSILEVGDGNTYPAGTDLTDGEFTATQVNYYLWAQSGDDVTAVATQVVAILSGVNNALLVYDFRTQGWQGYDTGPGICPTEFAKITYNGQERLIFTGSDGWCNLVEEGYSDQIGAQTATGTTWQDVATDMQTRGLTFDNDSPKRFHRMDVVLAVNDCRFTLTANTGAAYQEQTVRSAVEFSRAKYLKPFDRTPYVTTNENDDHATPGRGNYSAVLPVDLGASGITPEREQEVTVRASLRSLAHRYTQLRVTNDQGRCSVMAIATEATPGQNRDNVLI